MWMYVGVSGDQMMLNKAYVPLIRKKPPTTLEGPQNKNTDIYRVLQKI